MSEVAPDAKPLGSEKWSTALRIDGHWWLLRESKVAHGAAALVMEGKPEDAQELASILEDLCLTLNGKEECTVSVTELKKGDYIPSLDCVVKGFQRTVSGGISLWETSDGRPGPVHVATFHDPDRQITIHRKIQ